MIYELRVPHENDFNFNEFENWCSFLNKDLIKLIDKDYWRSIVHPNWWSIRFNVENKNTFFSMMQVYFQDVEWKDSITIKEIKGDAMTQLNAKTTMENQDTQ